MNLLLLRVITIIVIILCISDLISFVECQLTTLTSCNDNPNFAEVDIPASLVYEKKKVTFRLKKGKLNCVNGTFFYTIKTHGHESLEFKRKNEIHYFFMDGTIRFGNEYFNKDDYCIKKITKSKVTVQVCKINCTTKNTMCIPKCCEIGKSFNIEKNRCSNSEKLNWSPNFYDQVDLKSIVFHSGMVYPHYFIQNLKCLEPELFSSLKYPPAGFQSVPFRVLNNGSTIYFNTTLQKWINLPLDSYCLEDIEGNANRSESEMLAVCTKLIPSEIEHENLNILLISVIFGIVICLSCLLYLVTIVVYIILWKEQKFHMYIVISYVISLLLLHIFYGTSNMVQLEEMAEQLNGTTFCIVIGAATHLFILSTFCWLTMINMNLWSTFSTLNIPHVGLSDGTGDIIKFILFSLFSWGIPILVVVCGLILDNLNKNGELISSLGTIYGQTGCLLSTEAEGWYLFYPIGVLLIFNLLFFVLTVCRLFVYQRITRNVIGDKNDKKWRIIIVYLKLLIIAIILWAFELICWILKQEGSLWYWLIIDLLNLIQSIVIFTMFVCRRNIFNQLQKKFPIIIKFSSICSSICCCRKDIS